MKSKPNPFRPFIQLQNLESSGAAMTATIIMLLGFAADRANAQTTGFLQTGAGTYDYDDTANWVDGTINGIWDPTLALTVAQVVTFDSDLALTGGLTFGYTGAFNLTLRGDGTNRTITLGGDISVAPASNQTVTLGSGTAGQNLNVNLGGTNRALAVDTSKTLVLSNIISSGSIDKTGSGSLTLSGANTFSGLTLSGGTLLLGNNTALGSGTVTIGGGTTLNVSAARTTPNNNIQNWNGDFTFTGSNTLNLGTGTVTINSNRIVTVSASTLTVGGTIGQSATGYSLTKAGAGTLVLNGANTYSGGTVINAGVLTVGATGNLGGNVSGNNVAINGGILNLGAAANIGNLQTLTLGSSTTVLGGLGLAFNALPTFTPSGSGPILFGINTTGFDAITSQSTVGTGNDFLGSTTGGTFSGTSLGTGLDGTYRLGGGGGTLTVTNAVLTGSAPLVVGSTLTNGGGTVILQGANNLTGATSVRGGTLKLSGTNGSLASSIVTVTGQAVLNLDSSASGVTGTTRAAAVNLKGGSLTLNGNSGIISADTVTGDINIDGNSSVNGINYITLTPNAGKNALLSANSLTRSNGGAVQISGSNLGAAPANGVANFTLTTPPTLSGTGTAGTTSVKVLPWAIGSTTSGNFSDFITYDTNGFRPLTSSEYVSFAATGSFTGTATGDNVKISSAGTAVTMTLSAPTTVNSLYMSTSSSSSTLTGSTITVASGAVFLTNGNSGVTIASNLDFASTQGVVGFGRGKATTISGNISGSGGLVLYQVAGPPATGSGGTGIILTGISSTYTGDTYIIGRVDLSNNVLPNSANGARSGNIYDYGMLNFNGNALVINGLYGDGVVNDNNSGIGTLTVGDNNADGNFSGTINENAALSLFKIGTGSQKITSAISITGATTLRGGVLETTTLANGGVASGIGRSSNTATNLVISGGTLKYTGAATSSDRLFTIGALGGTLDSSGTGALNLENTSNNVSAEAANRTGTRTTDSAVVTGVTNFTDLAIGARVTGTGIPAGTTITALNPTAGEITLSAAATANSATNMSFYIDRALTLTGSNTGNNTVSGVLANSTSSSKLGVIKSGSGKWILSASNTYSGDTEILAGTLSLTAENFSNDQSAVRIASTATLALDFVETGSETVARLFIGGVQQPAGTYKASGNLAEGSPLAQLSGIGLLIVSDDPMTGDDYATWAANNADGQNSDLDYDNDGTPNGVEYFMGETTPGFTANPGIVGGKVTWPKYPAFSGTYVVQKSTDLSIWTPVTVTDNGDSIEYILPTGQTEIFVRLKVTPQ